MASAADSENKADEDIADWITNNELDTNPLLAALEDLGIHATGDLDKELHSQATLDALLKGARKQLEEVLKPFVVAVNEGRDPSEQLTYRMPMRSSGSSKRGVSSRSTRSTRTVSTVSSEAGAGQPMKTQKQIESERKQNDGRDLKRWMQSNNIFNLDVFDSLVSLGYTSVEDFAVLQEKEFDKLRTKVRAATRKNIKDAKKLQRVDKTLTKVEKEWRLRSGKRKTLILQRYPVVSLVL